MPSGTVSFAAGETSQTVTVNVAGDTAVESDEGFTVTLSASQQRHPQHRHGHRHHPERRRAAPARAGDCRAGWRSRPKGDSGHHRVHLHRHPHAAISRPPRPRPTRSPAAARNPADAGDFGGTLPGGTVSFAAGETSKTVTVNVAGDTAVEPERGLHGDAEHNPTNATLSTATATGTIQNDDVPPPPALAIAALACGQARKATRGTTAFTFTVTRTGDLSGGLDRGLCGDRQRQQSRPMQPTSAAACPMARSTLPPTRASQTVTVNVARRHRGRAG
ncbi:MAG: hypothetical protein M0C28_06725 [Candidatus Moduliflexus flocculans]|nr:hypothetical protein [Candidatus Moduliflexus flocculans]